MSERSFTHAPHGKSFHDISIMLGKRICALREYQFLDSRALHDKHIYPGVPDLHVRRSKKTPSGAKVLHGYEDFIIEFETHPTKDSRDLKAKQFSTDGHTELLIIDLRKLAAGRKWEQVTLGEAIAFFEEWIP